ncbi:hypothetical protein EYF80_042191 [Liparis tanakae]|uniref:Uncharacterized protein n=1 Tax=Liparis tanakae TaxID=230148 RepID=A0A4Z2G208_9TELE|nr:hypothetical protein EYF80_042191 [Liparis tanakae]
MHTTKIKRHTFSLFSLDGFRVFVPELIPDMTPDFCSDTEGRLPAAKTSMSSSAGAGPSMSERRPDEERRSGQSDTDRSTASGLLFQLRRSKVGGSGRWSTAVCGGADLQPAELEV